MAIDEKKQTAKEMFEALGYKWSDFQNGSIECESEDCKEIFFDNVRRTIKFWGKFSADDVKAILKQCEELCWIKSKLSLENKTSDKWIPCSERLPNKEQDSDVLVTYFDRLTGNKWVDKECYFYGVWVATLNEFETRLAWRELPEPYKGE